MIIKIVVLIFLVLVFLLAYFLWSKRNSSFLIFNSSQKNYKFCMTATSLSLGLITLFGIFFLFLNNILLNLLTISLARLVILFFGITITKK